MIELQNVSKEINGRSVLDNINFCFENGKVYGLKGINGSGKTMLMRIISGLIYPTEGCITIDGKVLGKDCSFPESLGLLIENPVFLDSYTGLKNLMLLASLKGECGRDTIIQSLCKVGLEPNDKRKYRKYSLGMKQRLGIAAAIMENPQIILFDEPLNALDQEGVMLFTEIIREERKKDKVIVLSCHDEAKLNEYSDVIVELENGRIIKAGEIK